MRPALRRLDALAGPAAARPQRPTRRSTKRPTKRPTKNQHLQHLILEILAHRSQGATVEDILRQAHTRGHRSMARPATQRTMTTRLLTALTRTGAIKKTARATYAKA